MSATIAPVKEPAKPTFQQRLGLFDSTMLVAGTMIGSGIFITSADISRDVGSAGWLLAVWVLAGVMTIIGALSYAELAAMMPNAGGQYVYLRESYSPLWGFLYGWTCFLVIQTGSIAAVGVAFAKFLGVLEPKLGTDNIIYTIKDVDIKLFLPFMYDANGEPDPFFKMKDFTVSAGQLVAVVVVGFLTLLNCRGVQEGKIVQNIFTVAKTLALILLILVGLAFVSSEAAHLANSNWWGGIRQSDQYQEVSKFRLVQGLGGAGWVIALMVMGGAMVGSLFSADAWNNITFTAGEIKNPRRNLPLSLALGTGMVILLYVLANVAYIQSLPVRGDMERAHQEEAAANDAARRAQEASEKGQTAVAADAEKEAEARRSTAAFYRGIDHAKDDRVGTAITELLSPRLGAPIMAFAIMISTFGCVNGMILMGARLYYAMAQDGLFFRSVGTLNNRGVPATGLILQGIWSILLVFSGTYSELLDYVIFAVLVFYVLTVTGLFVLRRRQPNVERPYKAFGYPVLPALYVFLCAVIMVDLLIVKPKYTWPGLIIVLTGIPVYFLWRLTGRRTAAT
jgi:basic amino acid/polyamine antiporter, APA family